MLVRFSDYPSLFGVFDGIPAINLYYLASRSFCHVDNLTGLTVKCQGTYSVAMANSLNLDLGKLQGVGMNRATKLVNRAKRGTFNRSQVLVPVDHGVLRGSARMTPTVAVGTKVRAEVIYDAEYAAAVHNGRRALTIRARGRKALRFVIDGEAVFARVVHQPARKGRPYLSAALFQVAVPLGFQVSRTVTIG